MILTATRIPDMTEEIIRHSFPKTTAAHQTEAYPAPATAERNEQAITLFVFIIFSPC